MRSLFLESVSGIAGDMFVAAFLDAGLVGPEELAGVPEDLGLAGVRVEVERVRRATIEATHVAVRWEGTPLDDALSGLDGDQGSGAGHSHGSARYVAVDRLLAASDLDDAAKRFARGVYRLLAEAEGAVHGRDLEHVSFHEVGSVDSVVDVAMAGLCISRVAPERVLATPLKLGRGTVEIAHGTQPVPPPATARLVTGMPVGRMPPAILESDVELSTPTGVAILKALSPAFVDAWPVGVVRAQGMGAGSRSFDGYPNVFRIALFDAHPEGSPSLPYEYDSVVEICCNLDDETPERTAWLAATALEMGALDVWTTPVVGKKGRAAVTLSLLVAPSDLPRVGDWLLRRSSTFGLRYSTWDRLKLSREVEIVETPRGQVSVQVGSTTDGEILKSKPEHDDLARIWAEDPDFEFRGPDTVTGE